MSDSWYTPPEIISAASAVMGGIDLDPASTAEANKVVAAKQFYDATMDGLMQTWWGRVWLNPPYSQAGQFITRLLAEYQAGNVTEAVALTHNITETSWFQDMLGAAPAVCFPYRRVQFWGPELNHWDRPPRGQVIFYLGPESNRFATEFGVVGRILTSWRAG